MLADEPRSSTFAYLELPVDPQAGSNVTFPRTLVSAVDDDTTNIRKRPALSSSIEAFRGRDIYSRMLGGKKPPLVPQHQHLNAGGSLQCVGRQVISRIVVWVNDTFL